MSNTRIIVTGGSGFIGTNLCEYLIEKNYDFINLDINPPKVTGHREYWKEIDIRDKGLLSEIIEYFKPTYIINLAADLGMDHNSLENLQTNKRIYSLTRQQLTGTKDPFHLQLLLR